MKALRMLFILLAVVTPMSAAKQEGLESLTIKLAPTASDAVIPILAQYNISVAGHVVDTDQQVVGTGFFVDTQGDFVTALHVMDMSQLNLIPNVADIHLLAMIRQAGSISLSGTEFHTVDRDENRDLVLCRIKNFHAITPDKSAVPNGANSAPSHPFASLAMMTGVPKLGQFVIVSGFPLGTLTPSIQVGIVSSTRTLFLHRPPGLSSLVKEDRADLLQVAVNANHDNSGGPVIDTSTGRLLGVALALVGAPLSIGEKKEDVIFDQSGIMLTAPAPWVQILLDRNHIRSEAIPSGKLVIR